MRKEVLRMQGVTCLENGVEQLRDFNLQIFAGEIMGLLTVTSAGLDTLVRLLCESIPLRRGYIYYRERQINAWYNPGGRYTRIGVIGNKSSLIGGMTVADNIFVLRRGFKSWLVRPGLLRSQLEPMLRELEVDILPDDYIDRLSAYQRFVVELLKLVLGGCRLIILREVSTFISDSSLSRLHALIRRYVGDGVSFLYIGYHFEELSSICTRTAVFENGTITKVLQNSEEGVSCGEPYSRLVRSRIEHSGGDAAHSAQAFSASGLSGGNVRGLTFSVAAGGCLVLQDLHNRIFGDLLSLLIGERPIEAGELRLGGERFVPRLTRKLAIVQEEPSVSMIMPGLCTLDNLCFTIDHRLPQVWRSARLRRGLRKEYAGLIDESLFDVWPDRLTRAQKYDIVYSRVLLQRPAVAFCVQPFKGADMRLRMRVWNHIRRLTSEGIAVVILAVNLADCLSLADRLIRIHRRSPDECYDRSEFARLPIIAPWIDFYSDRQKQENIPES